MKTIRAQFFMLFLVVGVSSSFTKAKSDFETVKIRVTEELMEPAVVDTEVQELLNTIQEDGTWPGINYQDVSRTAFEHRFHLDNMVKLARAYKSRFSNFRESKKVKAVLELALKNWVDHDYFCENWWYNQIGTPNSLVTIMVIIGDDLPKDLVDRAQPIIGRAHIDAGGARPGGDRIKIASIQAKNLLFLGDSQKFDEIVCVIENEIKYVEWIGAIYGYSFRHVVGGFENRSAGGRGIQYDNSFHHRIDGVNNTLSYGLGYADAFVEWAVYTAGTKYAFADDKLERLIDYFLDGICKTAVFGKYPDPGAKNRSISRIGTLHPYNAETAENLLLTSDYRKSEIQEIADIRSKGVKPTVSHATFYWHSEHFTYQRPDFFTSVRMYSTRTHNMEQPYNSEGLLNHHRGDGTNHISRTGDEYYDIAPVFDYQKIPGATIMQKPELPSEREIQKLGLTDFVGAVTDGKYGAAAFDFKSPHDPLVARKSWFFFDDEYVCLGAGISCKKELPVVTTVNQCLLRGEVIISSKNERTRIERGESEFDNVDWVFQDGVAYIFPEPAKVNIQNNAATGSWWTINKQTDSPKDEVKMDVFKIWLDHGERPSDASYAYIVAPAPSLPELIALGTSKENIVILSNTPQIQAVRHLALNMTQIVFYKAGKVELSDGLVLESHVPGIFLIKTNNNKIKELSVADPNRELKSMHFSVNTKIGVQHESYSSTWNEIKSVSEISIDLPQGNYAGQSVNVSFN